MSDLSLPATPSDDTSGSEWDDYREEQHVWYYGRYAEGSDCHGASSSNGMGSGTSGTARGLSDIKIIKSSIARMTSNLTPQANSTKPSVPAFVFDIDGVFKNGGKYNSYSASVLRKLQKLRLPYVFMTNGGGGRTENQYAEEMSKKIAQFDSKHVLDNKKNSKPEEYATAQQMVLSYTPFDYHLGHLKNSTVLVVGCHRAIHAAKHFGFKHPITLSEYAKRHPLLNPFSKKGCEKDDKVLAEGKENWEHISAILVFTDPGDFFEALQILTDVLLSSRPGEVEYERNHRIPIIFSNPDLLWKTQFPFPRFGQGAFRISLEACYKARMQALKIPEKEIEARLEDFIAFGKPHPQQFLHAREAALGQAKRLGVQISHFYMVGDNPSSDIAGAVQMNALSKQCKLSAGWSGLLVRTGVFVDGEDKKGASAVFNSVVEAVDSALEDRWSEILMANESDEHIETRWKNRSESEGQRKRRPERKTVFPHA
mmetsp:Transcript_8848/g.13203  ORF Transcript_8848/g.13203 Transcript_8848/m.13203 type:complete len:483 (+) Transcript_8848:145-1593(+)|eukprot:CAMPEP_0167756616 /NCGR_PEP_ID=MMETSP0110_2-20121227/9483_1 /TAXON_ID=629695 /ORGANISM="Gymnochlora sp., Strain CCMP2014" /LENGTH=482 /DNA_ID=CAMNT_0007642743 /DNA_START=37 /DNA_END=1485 /DNA_ORIENTATION=+